MRSGGNPKEGSRPIRRYVDEEDAASTETKAKP
jgi:hypothetical protein